MHTLKQVSYLALFSSMTAAYTGYQNAQNPIVPPVGSDASSSRRTIIHTSSEAISGSYSLYDLLSITTQSGRISVSISPHSASSDDPSHPATLQLKTNSGSIHASLSEVLFDRYAAREVQEPDFSDANTLVTADDGIDIGTQDFRKKASEKNVATQSGYPEREYITSIQSQSGAISGTFPLGTRTAFHSQSGALNGVELVVMPTNVTKSRRLSTISQGGAQSIRIVEDPFWSLDIDSWWDGMVSKHEAHSASISLEYPDSWEGTVDVETHSAQISVSGPGVEVIRQGNGKVVAHKGKADSARMIVRTWSGKVDVRFG